MDPRSGKKKADKTIKSPVGGKEGEDAKAATEAVAVVTTLATHDDEKKNVLYQKPITSAIRLNNNLLENLDGFVEVIEKIMDTPQRLSWVDLSFNNLTTIDQALLHFPNLSNLNLHANHISELKEIRKLSKFTELRMLTLHGNPVVEKKFYR
jgi:hypothetical protein